LALCNENRYEFGMKVSFLTEVRRRFWVVRDGMRHRFLGKAYRQSVFTEIHEKNMWGDPESLSGRGSSLSATERVRRELPALMRRFECRSLLDAPCGDFTWMKTIVPDLRRYHGVDIVESLIARNREAYATDQVSFECADLTADPLPQADLILCRDCFIHLPTPAIASGLKNFKRSGARYLLLTNYRDAGPYRNVAVGSFRTIDFSLAPFRFPPPLAAIQEEGPRELALWELATLQA
jgi:hypothetical protein